MTILDSATQHDRLRRPQKPEVMVKRRYYCCGCSYHGNRKLNCARCGSEDVFDKTLPEWPCPSCRENTALFESTCEECQKHLLGYALAKTFGVDLEGVDNPMEDYGAPEFRVFRGSFLGH